MTLVGLVSKNGILIVEFANKLQEQGEAKLAAIEQAAMTRLRPILMTSAATIAGHFPLTLVTGAGAAREIPSVWCWSAGWRWALCSPSSWSPRSTCWWPATTPGTGSGRLRWPVPKGHSDGQAEKIYRGP